MGSGAFCLMTEDSWLSRFCSSGTLNVIFMLLLFSVRLVAVKTWVGWCCCTAGLTRHVTSGGSFLQVESGLFADVCKKYLLGSGSGRPVLFHLNQRVFFQKVILVCAVLFLLPVDEVDGVCLVPKNTAATKDTVGVLALLLQVLGLLVRLANHDKDAAILLAQHRDGVGGPSFSFNLALILLPGDDARKGVNHEPGWSDDIQNGFDEL